MSRQQIIDSIDRKKLIAIMRGLDPEHVVETANALLEGGVKLVELTFDINAPNTFKDTQKAIEKVVQHFGGQGYVGAGTVMSPQQVDLAYQAGAKFIISPNYSQAVIERTRELGLVSIPGAMTPTEIVQAREWGADYVKLFPASSLGVDYFKSILAPISNIPILVVGGIDISNITSFLKAGAVGAGIGGKLVDKELIHTGQYDNLMRRATEMVRTIEEVG